MTTVEVDHAPDDGALTTVHSDARWVRPALIALLVGTAALYFCNLSANGYANTFYSAAAQAGAKNWEALLFGSADAGNTMSVDKPPVFLWLMGLSIRVFGLNPWSLLGPQVLLGVASVAMLHLTTKRRFGPAAGLLAGLALAFTPVAALMFRFDNPDAMLTFLMTAAAWAMLRAVDTGRTRDLILTGVLSGLGLLTKDLAVMLIVPGIALTYLIAGPARLGRRVAQVGVAGVAMVLTAGWWVALVELLPAGARPYIGGSTDNSFLSVLFGGNGFDRLLTNGGDSHSSSDTGLFRLFDAPNGGQISWLLPTAGISLLAGLVLRRLAPRTDPQRSALILWAGWLLISMAVYSFMSGTFHQYYTIAIAPPIAGLTGAGLVLLWQSRGNPWGLGGLVAMLAVTGAWSAVLLARSPEFLPWLRWLVLALSVVGVVLLTAAASRRSFGLVVLIGVLAGLAGPAACTARTISTAHTGAVPTAGPPVQSTVGGGSRPTGAGRPGLGGAGNPGAFGWQGGLTGPGTSTPGTQIRALLAAGADSHTWVAATTGSIPAASYQLATELPVMGIGGFNGGGAAPTLAQFQDWVTAGRIHYYLVANAGFGRAGRSGGTQSVATQIQKWVAAHFSETTVDGVTMYDLTGSDLTTR